MPCLNPFGVTGSRPGVGSSYRLQVRNSLWNIPCSHSCFTCLVLIIYHSQSLLPLTENWQLTSPRHIIIWGGEGRGGFPVHRTIHPAPWLFVFHISTDPHFHSSLVICPYIHILGLIIIRNCSEIWTQTTPPSWPWPPIVHFSHLLCHSSIPFLFGQLTSSCLLLSANFHLSTDF
jgi:hypothetical protein